MNTTIFQYLHSFAGQNTVFDAIIIFCAKYFPYIMVVALGLFFIFGNNRKRELKIIFYVIVSVILSRLVITEIIRYFYPVARPFIIYSFTPLLYDYANSFPSGHAAVFFALATAVFFFHKKWGIAYFLGAIIISISRIMAGIHWPMDNLGGLMVGIGSAVLVHFLIKKISRNSPER